MDKKILSFEEFSSRKPFEIPENDFWKDSEIEEEEEEESDEDEEEEADE